MAITPYLSIIKCTWTNSGKTNKQASKKPREQLNRFFKSHLYLTHKSLTQMYKHTQSENKGMEKYIPCSWKPKESWGKEEHKTQTVI